MSSLGIYFGPKVITVVETSGKKFIKHIQIPQTTISAGELEEKVPTEVKTLEIIALLKDELRKNKIDARNATLCLSGKDLITRTFEIPVLPREELHSAINFEAKKYIPFKIEDLISDFQFVLDKISHVNIVIFMGIKKEVLERYISILTQLNIRAHAIEYSAFSVLRILRLSGVSDKGVIGVLTSDLKEEDEVNFTVLENGFPLFSRDITLMGDSGELGKIEEAAPSAALERLKSEIRVSLGYYQRKFPVKNIQKIFLISNKEHRSDLEGFMTENSLSAQFIDADKVIGKLAPYSLSLIKGYSSSLSRAIRINLKLNLLAAQTRSKHLKPKIPVKKTVSLVEGIRLDARVIALALLLCIFTFSYSLYRKQFLSKEAKKVILMRPEVSVTIKPQSSLKDLAAIESEVKKRLNAYDSLINKQVYVTELLEIIPRVIPKGVWLTQLSFSKKEENKVELSLRGYAYLDDNSREFEAANKFLSNLKESPEFSNYFKEMNIVSMQNEQLNKQNIETGTPYKVSVTGFTISCKVYPEKR
jgi:Tfp pilus assembly protein PilN